MEACAIWTSSLGSCMLPLWYETKVPLNLSLGLRQHYAFFQCSVGTHAQFKIQNESSGGGHTMCSAFFIHFGTQLAVSSERCIFVGVEKTQFMLTYGVGGAKWTERLLSFPSYCAEFLPRSTLMSFKCLLLTCVSCAPGLTPMLCWWTLTKRALAGARMAKCKTVFLLLAVHCISTFPMLSLSSSSFLVTLKDPSDPCWGGERYIK